MKKILDSTEHIFKFEFDKISSFKVCPTGATTFGHTERDWSIDKQYQAWEVVVAQLVERSLPIPEVRGSNPVIGKNLLISNICILSTVY